MSYPVTYYCPRCGTLVEVQREGYLADKAVTPYPFEGWTYADPDEPFEEVDGVRVVCGESAAPGLDFRPNPMAESESTDSDAGGDVEGDADDTDDVGCSEPFYLSFVRFENGEEIEPHRPSEQVTLAADRAPRGPRGPDGPKGPDGW